MGASATETYDETLRAISAIFIIFYGSQHSNYRILFCIKSCGKHVSVTVLQDPSTS